ncbi:MAG: Flp pilus assembly protein CpaB [Alphaproteobacteria bacterium]|nr:Flp pilus assembly protein CpaB [Alphaproteobacteria bacterium]
MNPRTILLGIAALLTAGLTAMLVQGWLERQRANLAARPNAPVIRENHIRVIVSARDLGAGSFIKADHLRWQAWPKDGLAPSYLTQPKYKRQSYVGAVVRRGIAAGEPVTSSRIVKPGDRGFLAAVVRPGLRAVAVPLNATSSIAGLVFPGDRVDLILSHRFESEAAKKSDRKLRHVSETVLTNVRVLAIDQSTDDQKAAKKGVPKTATLEVSPKQAEMVAVALNLGSLSLSLRSLANDHGENADPTALFSSETEDAVRGRTLTTGSEVSRIISAGVGRAHVVNVLRGDKTEAREIQGK